MWCPPATRGVCHCPAAALPPLGPPRRRWGNLVSPTPTAPPSLFLCSNGLTRKIYTATGDDCNAEQMPVDFSGLVRAAGVALGLGPRGRRPQVTASGPRCLLRRRAGRGPAATRSLPCAPSRLCPTRPPRRRRCPVPPPQTLRNTAVVSSVEFACREGTMSKNAIKDCILGQYAKCTGATYEGFLDVPANGTYV